MSYYKIYIYYICAILVKKIDVGQNILRNLLNRIDEQNLYNKYCLWIYNYTTCVIENVQLSEKIYIEIKKN